jgi:hypothetical protein
MVLLAVACSGAPKALSQTQFRPVGGTVNTAIKALWVNKGFQQ